MNFNEAFISTLEDILDGYSTRKKTEINEFLKILSYYSDSEEESYLLDKIIEMEELFVTCKFIKDGQLVSASVMVQIDPYKEVLMEVIPESIEIEDEMKGLV